VFYLHDKSVVKVMFTAIVTTMVGLFLLSTVECSPCRTCTSSDVVPAQLLGGWFGAGFVIGGTAGTSVAGSPPARRTRWSSPSACWPASWPTLNSRRNRSLDRGHQSGRADPPDPDRIGMGWWTAAFVAFLFAAAHGMECWSAGLRICARASSD